MYRPFFFTALVLSLSCFLACRPGPTTTQQVITLGKNKQLVLLDSTQAATFIIKDDMEHFFENISSLDMMIQMKKNYQPGVTRNKILHDYKDFLQWDVSNFSETEEALLHRVWQQVYTDCEALKKGLIPDTILLLKTPAIHYGPGVFYTREKGIVIPANELEKANEPELYRVMLHELFHIWSRLHPEKRQALYQLVGFHKLPVSTQELIMPDALRQRILLNPDGIDYSYRIQLKKEDGSTLEAIPLIQSNRPTYSSDQSAFFQYLSFQLFPIEKQQNGQYRVISQSNGDPIENLISSTNFLEIIGDNTDYIIHPDEILADNFVLWVLNRLKKEQKPKERSHAGKNLLDQMEKILLK
ncbi:MAG: hypothetical protein R2828_24470 [Saprospiraceae bacterium]